MAGHRVFLITFGNVSISGVTIRHGHGIGGAGIFNSGATLTLNNTTITENRAGGSSSGGAIFNSFGGTLTVNNSTISNNTASSAGGIGNFDGTLTVINSTISNNTASPGGLGGGFINQQPTASLTLINSTVSGNTASVGGGIHNGLFGQTGASLTLINSTVTGNTASSSGGGIHNAGGTVELANTILANNLSGSDCNKWFGAAAPTSLGHNLDSDNTCNLTSVGDLPNVNPLLGPLQDNGGFTDSHALLAGSPAIDAGNPAPPGSGGNACEATDQRGISRPQGTACDIGAFERIVLPGHFLSYDIKKPKGEPKFEKFEVTLADQFQTDIMFTVEKRVSLLNPVDKNGEGISDPDTHLVGYKVKQVRPDGVPKPPKDPRNGIRIKDQFFDELIVDINDVNKADRLLVPASKSLMGPAPALDGGHNVDHFLCYKVKLPKGTEFPKDIQVTLADQFIDPEGAGLTQLYDLRKPKRLCNPVDKNGERFKNEENHLICYDVKRPKSDPKHEKTVVFLNDQFGEANFWETKKEKELCVPAEKTLP